MELTPVTCKDLALSRSLPTRCALLETLSYSFGLVVRQKTSDRLEKLRRCVQRSNWKGWGTWLGFAWLCVAILWREVLSSLLSPSWQAKHKEAKTKTTCKRSWHQSPARILRLVVVCLHVVPYWRRSLTGLGWLSDLKHQTVLRN